MSSNCVYLIGSLRNPEIPVIGEFLRQGTGFEIFDEWWTASEDADDWLRDYFHYRKLTYKDAIHSYAAKHIFDFDKHHLDRSFAGVLVMPAGKSGHLELGYLVGQGKPTYVLFDRVPERIDIMYNFCTNVFFNKEDLLNELIKHQSIGTNVPPNGGGARLLGEREQSGEDCTNAFRVIGDLGSNQEASARRQVTAFFK